MAVREDLCAGLRALHEGFQNAASQQSAHLYEAVWSQLSPILGIVRLISKSVELSGDDMDVADSLAQIQPAINSA